MPERGDDTLTAFVRHLASERRLSPHTVKHYRRDLERAAPHLPPWTQVTVHDVRALVARLHRQGLGGRSLQRLLSTLRTFYTWMNREGLARDNPALDVRAPKSGQRLPKALDADQTRQLLDAEGGEGPLGLRDQAMLELLYACGLRLAELISLNLDSIDLASAVAKKLFDLDLLADLPEGRALLAKLAENPNVKQVEADKNAEMAAFIAAARAKR